MKNKEIEELLNTMKDKECYYVGTNGCLYQDLTKEEINLLLSYIEQLEKQAELGSHYKHLYSEVKKQKDDVVELIKKQDKIRNYYEYEECGYDEYNYDDDFKEDLLRMLGEIDDN